MLLHHSISYCFSQFDLGHVNCHHELNPIFAIFRTHNKQGRFIQLNLYRCMYFCQTKLLKLLSSLLVPQSRSRKVKLSLKSTYHPSFLTYKMFLWWLNRNIQLMPQKCFEQLHSWLITYKWRHFLARLNLWQSFLHCSMCITVALQMVCWNPS